MSDNVFMKMAEVHVLKHTQRVCVLVLAHSASTVRTFLGSKDILAGPQNLKGLFEGSVLILIWV